MTVMRVEQDKIEYMFRIERYFSSVSVELILCKSPTLHNWEIHIYSPHYLNVSGLLCPAFAWCRPTDAVLRFAATPRRTTWPQTASVSCFDIVANRQMTNPVQRGVAVSQNNHMTFSLMFFSQGSALLHSFSVINNHQFNLKWIYFQSIGIIYG